MAISRPGRIAAALLGVAALAAMTIWFGIVEPQRARSPVGQATGPGERPAGQAAQPGPAPLQEVRRAEPPAGAPPSPPSPSPQPTTPPAPAREAVAPSFDVVRVEPSGESVIAGRAAPNATVELLRDGKVHARALADASGLFAFVPPPLPPGSHEIALQATAPDGARARSRESVTVAIAEGRAEKPLIALTTPDKPTVILSAPDAPAAPAEAAKAPDPKLAEPARTAALPEAAKPDAGGAVSPAVKPEPAPARSPSSSPSLSPSSPAPPAGPRPQVRVASVEAEEGGRLFVTGQAAPGATVRLYLNDTLIAPGGAGPDGRVSFAIGRGVRPGGYRVRLDDVDPVSGEVRSRAEVEFRMPAPLAVELPPPAPPYVTNPPAPRAPEGRVAAAPSPPLPALGGTGASAGSPSASAPPPTAATGGTTAAKPPAFGQDRTSEPNQAPSPQTGRVASADAPAPPAPAGRELDPGTVLVPEINTAIVSRGDNLWRISKRVYGRGVRYTVIYSANQEQIRSPRLIYPGQVFVLPPEGGAKP
ncbi:MAG TPA: LysM peptidoglycan-binding domain-containing protein [Beijerinckiaceae bacterium]|jgi:nucleoid-associated protein YgaU